MFGPLGVPEILFILVLALLIFGPRRLPDVGRTLGKAMGEFRRASTELKRSINTEIALEDEDKKPRYTRTARPERGNREGGGGAKAAPQAGTVPRSAAGSASEPSRGEVPAGDGGGDTGDDPGNGSGGEGSGGDRDPGA